MNVQIAALMFVHLNEHLQVRFLCSINLLGSLFCMLAAIIFSTYFDGLVVLEKDKGYFITDNRSVNKFANEVLKVSLSGLSLTVISFTIVFLVRQSWHNKNFGEVRQTSIMAKYAEFKILVTSNPVSISISTGFSLHFV